MKIRILKCWFWLFYVDLVMNLRDFSVLHRIVREQRAAAVAIQKRASLADLVRAADVACVFYFKNVLCLQRSAATAIVLRRYGWPAQMIIGAEIIPFRSHAWVEHEGVVVNDKAYVREMYQVLDKC